MTRVRVDISRSQRQGEQKIYVLVSSRRGECAGSFDGTVKRTRDEQVAVKSIVGSRMQLSKLRVLLVHARSGVYRARSEALVLQDNERQADCGLECSISASMASR